jgi:FAD/FMN-containing dehydrogenase
MTDMLVPDLAAALDAAALRPGLLVAPGDAAYDAARAAWNLSVDQRPAAVALPESADDIVAVVDLANRLGLRVTAQGTGHNAAPLGSLEDIILIRTHLMRGVEIDARHRVARAEAGAQWQDVVGPAAEHGLAALHGSSPDVGVVGYTLGGGMSWYSRRYGMASSRVLAIEVVTADAELVRADRHHHRDLFWALCGGGGSFGIVTAIEFELFAPGPIQAGGVWFPIDRAAEVFNAWAEWAPQLPETVATSVRMLNIPPIPEAPEALRGKSFALVLVMVLGDAEDADRALAPIRALGPMMDTVVPTPIEAVSHLAMDPPNPVPAVSSHAMLDELSPAAVEAIVATASASKTLVVAYATLGGGAMARPTGGGALTALESPVLFFAANIAMPEIADLARAEAETLTKALAPFATDREYQNFREAPSTDPERFFGAATHQRLRAVKAAVDPHGRIVANHGV